MNSYFLVNNTYQYFLVMCLNIQNKKRIKCATFSFYNASNFIALNKKGYIIQWNDDVLKRNRRL